MLQLQLKEILCRMAQNIHQQNVDLSELSFTNQSANSSICQFIRISINQRILLLTHLSRMFNMNEWMNVDLDMNQKALTVISIFSYLILHWEWVFLFFFRVTNALKINAVNFQRGNGHPFFSLQNSLPLITGDTTLQRSREIRWCFLALRQLERKRKKKVCWRK